MNTPPQTSTARKPRQSIRQRLPKRDDSGLTTLEWLLIVAAVAGLAALAVVLVTRVVSETGEQIAGSSARLTSAEVQADSVEGRAKNADATDAAYTTWAEWDNFFTRACDQIEITYSVALKDAGKEMDSAFKKPFDDAVTADISAAKTALGVEAEPAAAGAAAQVKCNIKDK